MQVKDLFEVENELSLEDKKGIYKNLQIYINSKDYEDLISWGKEKWDALLEKIRKEVRERKKTELLKSKLDHLINHIEFLEEVKTRIDDTEWGRIVKQHLDTDIKRANDNIEIRVEELWDAPIYSKADMLKMDRAYYMTINEKINEYCNVYLPQKEQTQESMHPYEES